MTLARLRGLMRELGRNRSHEGGRVYLVGGATAVWSGWRESTIDVDLHGEPERLFRDIQDIKERLRLNVEYAQPEDFVPALAGADHRHIFIDKIGDVSFYHHDPYEQAFSKIVRGFDRDLADARAFVSSGMVDPAHLRSLVDDVPAEAYATYPALSRDAVVEALGSFLDDLA